MSTFFVNHPNSRPKISETRAHNFGGAITFLSGNPALFFPAFGKIALRIWHGEPSLYVCCTGCKPVAFQVKAAVLYGLRVIIMAKVSHNEKIRTIAHYGSQLRLVRIVPGLIESRQRVSQVER